MEGKGKECNGVKEGKVLGEREYRRGWGGRKEREEERKRRKNLFTRPKI